jgi:single-strand DNA-binding protein
MSEGLNEVTLLGNLSKDVELRATGGGKSVATLNIATNESYKDSSGNKVEKVAYHRVSVFGAQADSASKHLVKGQQVYIQGKLDYSEYEKDGRKVYQTNIIAQKIIFLAKPKGKDGSTPQAKAPAKATSKASSGFDDGYVDGDDDGSIPF